MIKANHTRFGEWLFRFFSKWSIVLFFKELRCHNHPEKNGLPMLLLGNHFSWWDGFLALRINDLLWKKKYHVMMLEEELQKRTILSKTGAFSINKKSRSMIESLNYCSAILSKPENILLIYPQGEIQTQFLEKITFQPGIDRIIEKSEGSHQTIFYYAMVDYFSSPRPVIDVYFREYEEDESVSLESQYNDFVIICRETQKGKKQ